MKPVKDPYVTCDYGVPGSWSAGYHTGRDYRASVGTPIYATNGGVVLSADWARWGDAYGLHIVIRSQGKGKAVHHGYCHMSRSDVHPGEKVRAGEQIGLSGDTGRTFGAHLHYEERTAPFRYADQDRDPRFPGFVPAWLRKRLRRQKRDHPNQKGRS